MKQQIFILLLILFSCLFGCSDNATSVNNNNNIYTVRSVNDTLSISAVTTNFTNTQDIEMYLSVDTAKLTLSVVGYGSGSGIFKLYHDTTVIYSKDISSNIQAIQQLITPRPTRANVSFSNFKGTAAIQVTK